MDLDVDGTGPDQRKLLKTLIEFGGYIGANATWIPNYGERYRHGEAISNAFVESAVNQVVSKRMVRSSRCAGRSEAPISCSRSAPGC